MPATIQFSTSSAKKTDCVIVPVIDEKPTSAKDAVPASVLKHLKMVMGDDKSGFDGKKGEVYHFSTETDKTITWYVFVGIEKKSNKLDLEKAGGAVFTKVKSLKCQKAVLTGALGDAQLAAMANGFYLRSYTFDKYKTKDKSKKSKEIIFIVQCAKKATAEKEFIKMKNISDAVMTARNYVNEPPNTLYPESYAAEIKKLMKGTGVKVTIIDDKKLEKMGAGALMAVGKGSERKPRLVIMEYDGRTKKTKSDKPFALVGKGVTFDTGGYSLKPRGSMETMKMDMGGSAAVVGSMKALAENKEPVYVVAAVALAENMIAGNAYRVDDILTSLSGQTIEIQNTDAEGRLCLADALTYIQDKFDPKAVVDVATLTGACMMAVGTELAGVFSNDKDLETHFWQSGEATGDNFWPLPVNKDFDKLMDSDVADMRNLGTSPYGGASSAAAFLQRFITNDRSWAHLDIAGTAWRKTDSDMCPKGGVGFGVRALYHWVANS